MYRILNPDSDSPLIKTPKTLSSFRSSVDSQHSPTAFRPSVRPESTYTDESLRDHKIAKVAHEFFFSDEYLTFVEQFVEGRTSNSKSFLPKPPMYILKVWDKILSLYQIESQLVAFSQNDTLMDMLPPGNPDKVAYTAGVLMPEVIKFPYSLYKVLKVRFFRFCGEIHQNTTNKKQGYLKRYYSWNFPIDQIELPEDIKKHFYKTLWFNIVEQHKFIEDDWQYKFGKYVPKELKSILKAYNNEEFDFSQVKGFLSEEAVIEQEVDMFGIFYEMVTCPTFIMEHSDQIIQSKGKYIKYALQRVDPNGINGYFWKERGY